MPTINYIPLDAEAVQASIGLVSTATTADLAKPTPCRAWTLYGLLAHMATQHYGFAAASRGESDPAIWKVRDLGDDPVKAYVESAEHVLHAFAQPGVAERTFPLAEFGPDAVFPGAQAISFHFIDYVVHSWDVAKSLGTTVTFAPATLEAAQEVAQVVPTGEVRRTPGTPFAPDVPWSGEDTLDRIVAHLGRNPTWPN
ncbi:TIGR03086 family metal-binding protein [Kribbella speibonae]|uniref:TIGR03086 family protein n=1 Tax=Kribbella speibonae TaxID=1572660 RepID=A0A4R0ICJ0_9ACTN|nr:TIGR03086 family metal-binding protein [Kribbella speibonae]TCC29644.1 TIGR03086 family protein [Kribbella speibonae]